MVSLTHVEETPTGREDTLAGSENNLIVGGKFLTGSKETRSETIETGVFRTESVRSPSSMERSTSGVAHFQDTNNFDPPSLLLGLHMIDLDIVRVAARVRSIADNSARFELYTWDGTAHWGSGCNWLKIPAGDPSIQWGSFSTSDDPEWSSSQDNTSCRIVFGRAYPSPPQVTVWLTAIGMDPNTHCRIATFATDVNTTGFTLHLGTWSDSQLTSACVTWLAYPPYRADVYSGTFSTDDVHPPTEPRRETAGRVAFWGARFSKPPRVFAALNKLEMSRGVNARLNMYVENITTTGMDWHADAWFDTLIHQVGASFLAFGE